MYSNVTLKCMRCDTVESLERSEQAVDDTQHTINLSRRVLRYAGGTSMSWRRSTFIHMVNLLQGHELERMDLQQVHVSSSAIIRVDQPREGNAVVVATAIVLQWPRKLTDTSY